ncbi:MAG: hypothetical protein KDF48_11150 [Rhodocyclaceae bacterium]|nr:hypothetical protein [Rhodocyclaceae bacterium]
MKEWTGIEIERARQGLEQASATTLGRMIFEFSRLDMNLGLMLAWAHGGSKLEKLTRMVAGYTFHKKLDFLAELAKSKYQANQEAIDAHTVWLTEAHEVRTNRNDLIHGRWGVDHINNQVVNIVGLPTGEQIERRYTISELKAVLERMQQLQKQLSTLREQWPV